jgi:ketosteroid isomerase-like protein
MKHTAFVCLAVFAAIPALSRAAAAQVRPGMGGNVGETRTAASAYRAQVRNIAGQLTAELGDVWDDADTSKPAAFYDAAATITVGPDETFEGRPAIRKAFQERLGRMRGVIFTLEGFDMSDELMFVRGTMSYEIVEAGAAPARTAMAFTMSLRLRRGDWIIQSHTIGGPAELPR